MPRFISGDELGNIKTLRYTSDSDPKTSLKTIVASHIPNAIQALASASTSKTIATSHADGSIRAYSLKDDDSAEILAEWTEERLAGRTGQRFVGLSVSDKGVYSCTSNGALRFSPFPEDANSESVSVRTAMLPSRLCDWKSSPDHKQFSYGGDEVELSVWDVEKSLSTSGSPQELSESKAASKKRKRNDTLFEGEIWRAKNVANDYLGLRQPVRISTLAYVTSSSNTILAGTEFGNVRKYDTRENGRRPVSDWSGFTQGHGIKVVQCGLNEHEAFVADSVNGLYALDLRNGQVLYKYRGLSGAITSVAPAPSLLASTSLDRLSRIHTIVAPPSETSKNGSGVKGEVIDKVYMKSIPTVIVWDGQMEEENVRGDEEDGDGIWDDMPHVGEESDNERSKQKQRKVT